MVMVLAVDGGNSKTDVALVDGEGALLAAVRGPTVSHQAVGLETGVARLAELVGRASRAAGNPGPIALGVYALAGADTRADVRRLHDAIATARIADEAHIRHDTDAALRAGTDRGWGVAVICGAGVAAAGSAPDGRHVRLAALGSISGDWGGGGDVAWAGLAAAVRARDGRGGPTRLARDVPAHFGLQTPAALTGALYRGRIPEERIDELAPVVFAAAQAGDEIARSIADRLADEVVAMAVAMIRRLHLVRRDPDVVLRGGVFRTPDAAFHERIAAGILAAAPRATVIRTGAPPVAGAALLGLDRLLADTPAGARERAAARVRAALERWDAALARP